MTRAEFFERLRYIRLKASPAVDKEARRAVRIQTLKAIARAQEVLLKGGNSESVRAALDKQNLAKEYLSAVNVAKEKTARLTSEANAEFLISQLKEAGIAVKENAVEGITEQIVNKVLKKTNAPFQNSKDTENAEHTDSSLKNAKPLSAVFKAKGWAADKGVGFYTIDPKTGAKKFVEKSFYMKFSKGYDLSSSVWKSVGEMESRILNTVWASRAQGRDAVQTGKGFFNSADT